MVIKRHDDGDVNGYRKRDFFFYVFSLFPPVFEYPPPPAVRLLILIGQFRPEAFFLTRNPLRSSQSQGRKAGLNVIRVGKRTRGEKLWRKTWFWLNIVEWFVFKGLNWTSWTLFLFHSRGKIIFWSHGVHRGREAENTESGKGKTIVLVHGG